jgi:transposase InsO family protein
VILDLFSRRVVGWKLAESLQADLVSTALHNALLLRQPGPGLVFHSERGCQYLSQHAESAYLRQLEWLIRIYLNLGLPAGPL